MYNAAKAVSPVPTRIGPATLNPELLESRDCKTSLRFYADALHAGLYEEATHAWGKYMGVSAATLEKRYSAEQPVSLELGEISVEGGAGRCIVKLLPSSKQIIASLERGKSPCAL